MTQCRVPEFLAYLSQYLDRSDESVKTYNTVLTRAAANIPDFDNAKPAELRAWIANLRHHRTGRPVARNTKVNHIYLIRSYFSWLCDVMDYRLDNPAAKKLHAPKRHESHHPPVPPEDVFRAIVYAKEIHADDLVLAIKLEYATGARTMGICNLEVSHIHTYPERKLELHEKGGKIRFVPLTPFVDTALEDYGLPSAGIILRRRDGQRKPVTARRLSQMVALHYRALGMPYTAHGHRVTFATEVGGAPNADVRVLQELLGHADLTSTQIYMRPKMEKARAMLDAVPLPPTEEPTRPALRLINGSGS